jgi:SAM-dependent methyltransferase
VKLHRTLMAQKISPRLAEIVDALPLRPGMRALEIGCGPGVAARAVLERIGNGHVLAIDRSPRAIAQARAGSKAELATGRLEFRQIAAEDLVLGSGEARYDLAFAIRVGALDGRHPEANRPAIESIRKVLVRGGHLYIDGGNPLRKVALSPSDSLAPTWLL